MKKSTKALIAFTSYIGFGGFSYATSPETSINTTDRDLVVGTITAAELEQQNLKDKNNPYYTKSTTQFVPPYIKLIKLAPNPNYKGSKTSTIQQKQLSQNIEYMPTSRMLQLNQPALDQGTFGTCVTMATVGAIQSQTTSQVGSASCILQLFNTLGQDAWNGYRLGAFISTLSQYGWMQNIYADKGFCNANYPTYQPYGSSDETTQGLDISIDQYKSKSYALSNYLEQNFSNATDALNYIKQKLNDKTVNNVYGYPGYYSVFAFYFVNPIDTATINGSTYPAWADHGSFVQNTGHVIYAYGYDDNATVTYIDSQHNTIVQKGVLYLRNSWGPYYGNQGNYVMTYDYFLRNYRTDEPVVSFQNIEYRMGTN